jgi:AcrR family transcriptional regulator
MDLYAERGYDQTTVAEIAQRAGLTERTFFRHFADKREVLFGGSAGLREFLVGEVARAPATAPPLEAVAAGLAAAGSLLQERRGRDFARRRQGILAQSPELQERELIKMASWAAALAGALRARGTMEPKASLVAEAGVAAFRIAFERWVYTDDGPGLPELIGESFQGLKELAAA